MSDCIGHAHHKLTAVLWTFDLSKGQGSIQAVEAAPGPPFILCFGRAGLVRDHT